MTSNVIFTIFLTGALYAKLELGLKLWNDPGIFAHRYTVLRNLRILPVGISFGLKLHFSPSFGTGVEFHVETRRYFKSFFSISLLLYSKNNSLGSILTYEWLASKMN